VFAPSLQTPGVEFQDPAPWRFFYKRTSKFCALHTGVLIITKMANLELYFRLLLDDTEIIHKLLGWSS